LRYFWELIEGSYLWAEFAVRVGYKATLDFEGLSLVARRSFLGKRRPAHKDLLDEVVK